MLLAVDLGLNTGWSLWDEEGRLVRFESRRFASRSKMRAGIPTILRSLPTPSHVVAEGDSRIAKLWFKFCTECDTELVQAQDWRPAVFSPRERRSGSQAKMNAIEFAGEVIKRDRAGPAGALNHDTAEAILLGYWWVRRTGWRLGHC